MMNRKAALAIKLAVAGGILAAGAAQAGTGTVNLPNTGNGDVMLYVYDVTLGNTYAEDLGVSLNSFITQSQAQGASPVQGTVSSSLALAPQIFAPDSNLSTYLTAHSGDVYQWGIMAGGVLASGTSQPLGSQLYLTSAATSLGSTYSSATAPNNLNVSSSYSGLQGTMSSQAGNFNLNGINANSSSTAFGAPGTSGITWGTNTQNTWYANGHITNAIGNGITTGLGTVADFYAVANAGVGGNSGLADIFHLGSVSLSTAGVLTFVPVPAAVWLFGSGLLGLAAMARRRRLEVVTDSFSAA